MFQMPASNSIWQQAEYNIPKLEDSLVISEGNKKESINVNTRVSVQQKSVKRKERSKTVSAETNVQEAKNTKAGEDKIIVKGVGYKSTFMTQSGAQSFIWLLTLLRRLNAPKR